MNLIKKLFPGVDKFYIEALCRHADVIRRTSKYFYDFVYKNSSVELNPLNFSMGDSKDFSSSDFVNKISDLEKEADAIAKEITARIRNSHSWQLPIDGDQILDLINLMDDIVDLMKAASKRMALYGGNIRFSKNQVDSSGFIVSSSESIRQIMSNLSNIHMNIESIHSDCEQVDMIESQADALYHSGLETLFDGSEVTVKTLMMERVYDMIEEIMDKCEDVTKNTSSIVARQV